MCFSAEMQRENSAGGGGSFVCFSAEMQMENSAFFSAPPPPPTPQRCKGTIVLMGLFLLLFF